MVGIVVGMCKIRLL